MCVCTRRCMCHSMDVAVIGQLCGISVLPPPLFWEIELNVVSLV